MFDYFYGAQSDQFSFYRVPKVMFTDPAFQNVSAEAKILYGLFLDRMGLSARNNWVDEQGRVYIIYTIDQIMKAIGCSDKKVNRMLRELEVVAGLIERKRQGLGKPKQFIQAKFVRPKVRPYQTDNYYAILMRQEQAEKEVNAIVCKAEKRAQSGKGSTRKSS